MRGAGLITKHRTHNGGRISLEIRLARVRCDTLRCQRCLKYKEGHERDNDADENKRQRDEHVG